MGGARSVQIYRNNKGNPRRKKAAAGCIEKKKASVNISDETFFKMFVVALT